MESVIKDIKEQKFQNIYLLYGEESFLVRSYKKRLIQALADVEDTMNYTVFSEAQCEVEKIIELADTMPFFSDKRVIVVSRSGFFTKSNDLLAEYLERMPKTTYLIFEEEKADKKYKLFKAVSKYGSVNEYKKQNYDRICNWIKGKLQMEQKTMNARALSLFLNERELSMELLDKEVEKLISYCADQTHITEEDILAISSGNVQNKLFELYKDLSLKNKGEVLRRFEDLLYLKETPVGILAKLTWQIHLWLQIKELRLKGYSEREIASEVRRAPWQIKNLVTEEKRIPEETLTDWLNYCLETDYRIKNGLVQPQIAVEMLLIRFGR